MTKYPKSKLKLMRAGILTPAIMVPALAGFPNAAGALSVPTDAPADIENVAVESRCGDTGLLQAGAFALTPAEKLNIAGDRIRLDEGSIRLAAAHSERGSKNVHTRVKRGGKSSSKAFLSIFRCNRSCHCSAFSTACC